jgi:hypothetical protein
MEIKCPKCNSLLEETECFDWEDKGDILWRLCEHSCPKCNTSYVTEKLHPLGEPIINIIEEIKD